ncbi:MAG TPA: DUF3160 domain-containing protein, partial [Leptolinea sp.]
AGETAYQNYLTQLDKLQKLIQAQTQSEWLDTFYSGWLFSFIPQAQKKGDDYPPLMATTAWQYKEATSALGSWAELKHDTALYTKMPEFMGGGGPPSSPSAPGYVEPNPNVFYRLAYISNAINKGLEQRGYTQVRPDTTGTGNELDFYQLFDGMGQLSTIFTSLGDIAAKELGGQSLSAEDYDVIQAPLGIVESQAAFAQQTGQNIKPPLVPVIAAVSGANNDVLEAAVGKVDRIYVVVPINGKLQIAQGGVFTYYEFKQPRSDRLTDEAWRQKLASSPPDLPAYTTRYILPGGKPADALAFRVGDVYVITAKGGTPPLNMRDKPSKSAGVVKALDKDTYLEFLEGPVKADGLTWWNVNVIGADVKGWVAENPTWYDRAHGQ